MNAPEGYSDRSPREPCFRRRARRPRQRTAGSDPVLPYKFCPMNGRDAPGARRVRCSQLVAELPKQILPPRDVILALDPFRRKPVDYAQQSSSLVGLGHHHLDRIRSRAEDPATSGTILIAFRTLTG